MASREPNETEEITVFDEYPELVLLFFFPLTVVWLSGVIAVIIIVVAVKILGASISFFDKEAVVFAFWPWFWYKSLKAKKAARLAGPQPQS